MLSSMRVRERSRRGSRSAERCTECSRSCRSIGGNRNGNRGHARRVMCPCSSPTYPAPAGPALGSRKRIQRRCGFQGGQGRGSLSTPRLGVERLQLWMRAASLPGEDRRRDQRCLAKGEVWTRRQFERRRMRRDATQVNARPGWYFCRRSKTQGLFDRDSGLVFCGCRRL